MNYLFKIKSNLLIIYDRFVHFSNQIINQIQKRKTEFDFYVFGETKNKSNILILITKTKDVAKKSFEFDTFHVKSLI